MSAKSRYRVLLTCPDCYFKSLAKDTILVIVRPSSLHCLEVWIVLSLAVSFIDIFGSGLGHLILSHVGLSWMMARKDFRMSEPNVQARVYGLDQIALFITNLLQAYRIWYVFTNNDRACSSIGKWRPASVQRIKRVQNTLPRNSYCSWGLLYRKQRLSGWNSSLLRAEFGMFLFIAHRTSSPLDEWRLLLDSAHQKCPEIFFHGILVLVGDTLYGGWIFLEQNFWLTEFETFLPLSPEPVVPWTKVGHSWIQSNKKVLKCTSTEFWF